MGVLDMANSSKWKSIATALLLTSAALGAVQAEPLNVNAANVNAANFVPALTRGDLVRLRSGGPLMTVLDVKGDMIDCIWTGYDGDPRDGTFPIVVLRKTDSPR
jgi:uncharacterized protein YodC (DUF2158 family)